MICVANPLKRPLQNCRQTRVGEHPQGGDGRQSGNATSKPPSIPPWIIKGAGYENIPLIIKVEGSRIIPWTEERLSMPAQVSAWRLELRLRSQSVSALE